MLAVFVDPVIMIIKFSVLCTICTTLKEEREEEVTRGRGAGDKRKEGEGSNARQS